MKNSPPSPHKVDPADAARELIRRRQARTSLLHFTNFTFSRYKAEPAHELIARALDDCVRGATKRLMLFMPPQHGKSELASVRLPSFWLGNRPNDPVILSSYAASLAENKSRQARQIVESNEYAKLFGARMTGAGSRAVDHWSLDPPYRGGMKAAGVGGPITGHGALLGIIDDPFENWEQAQSQTIRDKVWDWYRTTFRTRIWENGVIILIMTRWHEDDLAGRILDDQASEWTVLRLPAIAEEQNERDENNRRMHVALGQPDPLGRAPGQPLTPNRFSLDALIALKRDVGSLGWQAEYQGAPRLAEGNRFKRQYFTIIDAVPNVARWVRYWDKAASTSANAKYTAGVLLGITDQKHVIIPDVVRGKWSTGERRAVMRQTAELDAVRYGYVDIYIEQEPGSSGVDSVQDEIKFLSGFAVHADRPTGDKDVRLEPFAAQAEAGNVKLLRGAWNGEYIDELTAIPNGTYRDQSDATSGAYNKAARGGVEIGSNPLTDYRG